MEQKKRTSVHEFSVESPTHGNKNGKVYLNKFENVYTLNTLGLRPYIHLLAL